MKGSDIKALLIGLATALFILAVLAPFYVKAPLTEGSKGSPLIVGTNQLSAGANLYHTNGYHYGKVVRLDDRFAFADGTNRPGVLIRATNGLEKWIPRDRLTNALVTQ